MRHTFAVSSVAICLLFLFPLAAQAAAPRPAWVIPAVLNVRGKPGTSSAKIGALTRGTKVYITAFNNKWCRISYDGGKHGWAAEWLLQLSVARGRKLAAEAAKQAAQSPANPPAWVKVPSARVRAGPSTGQRHVTSIERGTKVHIIGQSGTWRNVKLASGTIGWMRRDLLEADMAKGQKLAGRQPAQADRSRPPKAFVKGDDVNVRKTPSTNSARTDQLDRGTTVWIIDTKSQWRKVKYADGKGGWIADWLLKHPGPTTQTSNPPARSAPQPDPPAPAPEPPLESMYGWVVEPKANVRYGPGMQFDVKKQVTEGTKVTVLDVEGHWCKVRLGAEDYGWLAAWTLDFLGPGNRVFAENGDEAVQVHVGWATGSATRVRAGPGTSHKRLATIPRGTEVVILDDKDTWYQVALSNNTVGWISADLISTREEALARGDVPTKPTRPTAAAQAQTPPVLPATILASAASGFGTQFARAALVHLGRGIRYVWGGSNPSRGFDCSGFVRYVLGRFDRRVPHSASQQYKCGAPISSEGLSRGDLVFFRTTSRRSISHVGIYIGGGQFIHSSSARRGVVVSTLRTGYYANRYAGACRIK